MEKIVRACLESKLSPAQVARKLGKGLDNAFSELIHILELSGFVSRDFSFKFDGTASKFSYLRVKDNYLRFYLKYIEPNKSRILKGGKVINSLFDLPGFESMLGFQFENLILANRDLLCYALKIQQNNIISAAPYIQNKNATNKGGCQIDLLIHINLDVFFLCEFKCRKIIDRSIIKEVQKKMAILKLPKRSALKPILVYEGEIYAPHKEDIEKFFFRVVSFLELLEG